MILTLKKIDVKFFLKHLKREKLCLFNDATVAMAEYIVTNNQISKLQKSMVIEKEFISPVLLSRQGFKLVSVSSNNYGR